MANLPALYTQFRGGWCDNCRTAFPFIPQHGCCPSCGPIPLRPATITVEPDDADEVAQAAALAEYMTCPAHGPHPHRGAKCLDCPDCVRSTEPAQREGADS